jgi:hypothetical protein
MGPVMAASIAAGMPSGSEGNAQPASGARAIALPASAPARIVATRSLLADDNEIPCELNKYWRAFFEHV